VVAAVNVVVAGAGTIGSLFAGHLAQVADVTVLTRRPEHAQALNERGLHVSGRSVLTAAVAASSDPPPSATPTSSSSRAREATSSRSPRRSPAASRTRP